MPKTINKVIVLKTTNVNNTNDKFVGHFKDCFNATRILFNEFVAYGLDEVHTKDGIKDLTKVQEEFYNQTDKSVTFEQFKKLLKALYSFTVGLSKSHGAASVIIGEPRSKDLVENYDFDTEKVSPKLAYKCSNTLKSIGFRNRDLYNISLAPGERYTVVENLHRMFRSWIKCDKLAATNYADEERAINEAFKKQKPQVAQELKQFFDFCTTNDIIKHFDPRVHAYLRDCVIPALKQDQDTLTDHFYMTNKDQKATYSLHDGFYSYLKGHKVLWEGDDPIILDTIHILEMIMSHQEHHPHAFYPFIGENDIHRFQYFFGNNYTAYDFVPEGTDIENCQVSYVDGKKPVTYDFTKGKKVSDLFLMFNRSREDKEKMKFRIHTKDMYSNGSYNPNSYFQNLSTWKVNRRNRTNLMEFDHKGQRVKAIVKEPAIVYTNGHYAVRLNMTVVKNDTKTNEDLAWFLRSALPATQSDRSNLTDTPENIELLANLKDKTFKLLGVDLGQRTPFSWAVGETTIEGMTNKVTITNTGEYEQNQDIGDLYYGFWRDLQGFTKLVGTIKSIKGGKTPTKLHAFSEDLITKARKHMKAHLPNLSTKKQQAYQSVISISTDKVLQHLTETINEHTDLENKKKNIDFYPNFLMAYIKLIKGEIIEGRRFQLQHLDAQSKQDYEFIWIKCIEYYKRVARSLSYLGTDNDREPIELKNINKYFNGVKDNYLKVIASSIVQQALDNDCQIIVMENLKTSANTKSLNKRNDNFMQSLWSPARIKGAIENAASWHDIYVVEVSESCTSKVHFETGLFGYRDGIKLYYQDGDTINHTHADINAAKNLIKKAVTRHGYTNQVYIAGMDDNVDRKQLNGFITDHFGTVRKAKEHFKKFDSKFACLHGDEWITMEKRNEIIDTIKEKVKQNNKEKLLELYGDKN